MATLAYPPFRDDAFGQPLGMSRSRSRRQSVVGYAGQQPVGFPYSDHPGMYTEPPMPVGLHEEVGGMFVSLLSPTHQFSSSLIPNLLIKYTQDNQTEEASTYRVNDLRSNRLVKPLRLFHI